MPKSRPATNPLSFHKHTGQYYVPRGRRRVDLGADEEQALEEYHRLADDTVRLTSDYENHHWTADGGYAKTRLNVGASSCHYLSLRYQG